MAKKSKRFLRLQKVAQEKRLSIYKVWDGYQITDNKIDGLNKIIHYLDDVEPFLKETK